MAIFKVPKYLFLVVQTANIIAFLTGTTIAWSSPILGILEDTDLDRIPLKRQITDEEASWIGSLAAMGAIFSPLIFGYLSHTLGRKLTLALISLPYLVAYLTVAFAEIIELYYFARFLMGLGLGGMFCVLPIYVVEIVQDENRGLLQATTATCIMIGTLFSYCIGPYVSIMTFNLILSAICIIFIPIFWLNTVETPYFLISQEKEVQAAKSLQILRSKSHEEIQPELEKIKSFRENLQPGTFQEIFKTRGTLKGFLFSLIVTALQQLSGVTCILYFTQNIFKATGSDLAPEICSIIVGAAQLCVSCISPPFLDRAGRRLLLLITSTGALISEILLGVYFYLQKDGQDVSHLGWLPVASLVLFIAFYNFGLGSIPWALMGELIPLNVISKAALLITSFYWFIGFWLTKYFGELSDAIGMSGTFWLFASFGIVFDLFVIFFMFETKGKSLREIQDILNK